MYVHAGTCIQVHKYGNQRTTLDAISSPYLFIFILFYLLLRELLPRTQPLGYVYWPSTLSLPP